MTDEQIEIAETLLGYHDIHGTNESVFPRTAHSEHWTGEAVALLRDMLPDWSAFKADDTNTSTKG